VHAKILMHNYIVHAYNSLIVEGMLAHSTTQETILTIPVSLELRFWFKVWVQAYSFMRLNLSIVLQFKYH